MTKSISFKILITGQILPGTPVSSITSQVGLLVINCLAVLPVDPFSLYSRSLFLIFLDLSPNIIFGCLLVVVLLADEGQFTCPTKYNMI
jgi:hypothetical protein